MSSAYDQIADLVRQEIPVSVATVVRPEELIGRRVVLTGGELRGSLGDVALDDAALAHGLRLLRAGQSKAVTVRDSAGQEADIFFDAYPAPPTLYIFGGVHVGIPLMKYAKILGFRVNVIDPRGIFATRERFAEADDLVIEHPEDYLARTKFHENAYVVVLTHDPKQDEPILERVVGTNVSYIGAIGSKKTNAERMERLMARGVSREKLAQVHSPIGLDIGSQVPEEIALAIMAEVVAARYGKAGAPLRDMSGAFASVGAK